MAGVPRDQGVGSSRCGNLCKRQIVFVWHPGSTGQLKRSGEDRFVGNPQVVKQGSHLPGGESELRPSEHFSVLSKDAIIAEELDGSGHNKIQHSAGGTAGIDQA
ncbi:MAG: hypothetical protein ABSF61_07750 [Anaerolineales bacterium]